MHITKGYILVWHFLGWEKEIWKIHIQILPSSRKTFVDEKQVKHWCPQRRKSVFLQRTTVKSHFWHLKAKGINCNIEYTVSCALCRLMPMLTWRKKASTSRQCSTYLYFKKFRREKNSNLWKRYVYCVAVCHHWVIRTVIALTWTWFVIWCTPEFVYGCCVSAVTVTVSHHVTQP